MTLAQLVDCLHWSWTWCSFSLAKSMQSVKKWLLHGWGNAGRNCSWGTCKHKPNYTTSSTSLLMLAYQVAKITVCFPVGVNRTKWYCVLSLFVFSFSAATQITNSCTKGDAANQYITGAIAVSPLSLPDASLSCALRGCCCSITSPFLIICNCQSALPLKSLKAAVSWLINTNTAREQVLHLIMV